MTLRRTAVGLLLPVILVGATTGCGADPTDGRAAGVSSPVPISGPTVLTTRTLPSLVPRPTSPVTASLAPGTTASALQPLVDAISAALADPERVPPNVEVDLKPAAGNQLIVSWIVNTNPNDPQARLNVRRDALTIMTVVRDAPVDHGSVLLNATGSYLAQGKRKDTVVVRAKYTRPLVLSTDWAAVPPEVIFTLCDDKPADIAPAFARPAVAVMRSLSIVLVALVALLGAPPPVESTRVPDTDRSTAPVVIILDASGSMAADDAPGLRIDAAKQAVTALVQGLPQGSPVGVFVYGTGTGSSDAERDAGCRDVRQLVPVGPVDHAAVISAVQDVVASGYTPMGAALHAAASALPDSGPASIVLVSDGIDTCAPPTTCEVASTLKTDHPDLAIHTVGFKEDAAAGAELSCVADAGGGTYRSAADGPGLVAILQNQVDAAMHPYLVDGIPVVGTPTSAGAPRIAAGRYWDTLAAQAQATSHYGIELARGQTIYFAATVVPPALRGGGTQDKLGVVTRLLDEQGNLCLATQREGDALLAGKVDPVTALISGVVGGPKWSKRCPDEGAFVVVVQRENPSSVPTPVEMIVQVEPPVVAPTSPVAAIPAGLPPPASEAAEAVVTGGSSFTTAPALTDGTWTDSLSTGETRYYRVHLDWGQRLSYRIEVDSVGGLEHGSGHVRSAVATPLRQELPLAASGNAAREFGGVEAVSLTGSTLVPVRYGNRLAERSDVRPYSVAGDHYLSVGLSYPLNALPFRTGIRISVQVDGSAEPGPNYLSLPEPSVRSAASPSSAAAPAGLASVAPVPDSAAPEVSAAGPWWLAWLIVIGCGATFAVMGVALVRILRKRSRSVG